MAALVKEKVREDKTKGREAGGGAGEQEHIEDRTRGQGPVSVQGAKRGPTINHNQGLYPFAGKDLGGGDVNVWGKMPEYGGPDSSSCSSPSLWRMGWLERST